MRVLLVDDDETLLRATTATLRAANFDVEGAVGGEQALELLRSQKFDAAVVDLMMPRMNGIEVIRSIQSQHPDVQVLLTSSFPVSSGQLERMGLEGIGFLTKPVSPEHLTDILDQKGPNPARKPLARSGSPAHGHRIR